MTKQFIVSIKPFVAFGSHVSVDIKLYVYKMNDKTVNGVTQAVAAKRHYKFLSVSQKLAAYEFESEYDNVDRAKLVHGVNMKFSELMGNLCAMAGKAEMPWLANYLRNEWESFAKSVLAQTAGVAGSEAEDGIIFTEITNFCLFQQNTSHLVDEGGNGFAL
jgi:hypothetical protein